VTLPRRDRLGGGRRDQRHAAGGQRRRAPRGDERTFQEAAPFGVEIVEQLLAVKLEVRAIAIIACTHRMVSLDWVENVNVDCAWIGCPAGGMQHLCQSPIPGEEQNRGSTPPD
jgi:hypothetical protein